MALPVVAALAVVLAIVLLAIRETDHDQSTLNKPPSPVENVTKPATDPSAGESSPSPVRSVSYSGHVWSTRGRPIAGAYVELQSPLTAPSPAPRNTMIMASATADSAGSYSLGVAQVQLGMSLVASADGYVSSNQPICAWTLGQTVDFFLSPSGSISGFVENQDHQPFMGLVVSGEQDDICIVESKPTTEKGAFLVEGLEEGTVDLKVKFILPVRLPGMSFSGTVVDQQSCPPIDLRRGEHREGVRLTVSWDTTAAISGYVVDDDNAPLVDAQIAAFGSGGKFLHASLSDEQGRFRVENLSGHESEGTPDTHVMLRCDRRDHETTWERSVEIGTENLVITMKRIAGGQIVGVVLDKSTRAPVADAHVCITENRASDDRLRTTPFADLADKVHFGQTKVNGDGEFRIPSVPSGRVSLLVYSPRYGMNLFSNIAVQPNKDNPVEILLEPKGLLRVHARYVGDLAGREAACTVYCKPEDAEEWDPYLGPESQDLLSGKEAAPSLVEAGVHEICLGPGRYCVAIRTETYITSPMIPGSTNFYGFVAEVHSGQVTDLDAPVGGTGIVRGTPPPAVQGESRQLIMVPGNTLSEEIISCAADTFAVLRYTEGTALFRGAAEEYEFNCIPEGTWTIGAFTVEADNGKPALRGSQTFQIETGDQLVWNFPRQ